jgi:5,6,7,8-tetrahydromethanopterin hydro-lyase
VAELDGRVGEGWAGTVPNGSHINVVLGHRGTPTYASVVGTLASSGPGHTPLLVCLGAGNPVRPATVALNKLTYDGEEHRRMTWGAAQLGIGQGVLDAVAEGDLDADHLDDLAVLVAFWVDPGARNERELRDANRQATRLAIADAVADDRTAQVHKLLDGRDTATNGFYQGD